MLNWAGVRSLGSPPWLSRQGRCLLSWVDPLLCRYPNLIPIPIQQLFVSYLTCPKNHSGDGDISIKNIHKDPCPYGAYGLDNEVINTYLRWYVRRCVLGKERRATEKIRSEGRGQTGCRLDNI